MEVMTIEVFNAIENYGRNILKSKTSLVGYAATLPSGESKNRLKVLDKESRETKFLSNLYGRKLLSFAYFFKQYGLG